MIIPTFYPVIGGTQSQVLSYSKRLQANGQTVRVMTRQHSYAHPDGLPARDNVEGVPVRRLGSRGRGKLGSFLYLLRGWWYLFRHGRRGIYHANATGTEGWLAIAARYMLGGRSLVKMRTGRHGYVQHYRSRIARLQLLALLRLADRVHVVNSEVERMVRDLGIPSSRIVRIPNAVDTRFFRPATPQEKSSARKRIGVPGQNTVILWVGRLDRVKGLDVMLSSWALLPKHTRAGAKLILVGEGPERDMLMAMVSELALSKSVSFVSFQRDVRDYYWAADIFVLPSRTEGLSGALVEAMACGLPAIASNIGGALDLVSEDQNGMLFERENHAHLAQRLERMLAKPDQWLEMGVEARKAVTAYADLDLNVDRLQHLYLTLA